MASAAPAIARNANASMRPGPQSGAAGHELIIQPIAGLRTKV
jgi:hypothetical protein